MNARVATSLRLAIVALWLAGLLIIGTSEWSSHGAIYTAVGGSLLTGLLVGRWWSLAAAPAVGVGLVAIALLARGPDPEMGTVGAFYVTGLYVLLVNTPLGLGVTLRRVTEFYANAFRISRLPDEFVDDPSHLGSGNRPSA